MRLIKPKIIMESIAKANGRNLDGAYTLFDVSNHIQGLYLGFMYLKFVILIILLF